VEANESEGQRLAVRRHRDSVGKARPLPSTRSRRRAWIREGQGPRRDRAQRAQAGHDAGCRFRHAHRKFPPSTRARPEQAGGGHQDDGSLTTSTSWSGDVSGSVSWQYNNDFNKVFETVTAPSGSATTAFGYDRDQLLTCASPTTCSPPGSDALRLIRSSQHGLITGIALGSTSETLTYNSVGELATQVATFGSTPLVNITYHGAGAASRDALGRIVQKTEVIGGVTKVYRYTYDNLRRLTDVTIDGVLEEHFEYDANGNRTLGYNRTAGTTWTGTYDDQDRLLSYGPFDYTYTANGELETKTNRDTDEEWLYQYDVLGNLLSVGLPDGRLIEYLVDGLGRRVGKKIDGVLLKQWVYRDALKPVAELDGAGNLVAEFVYGAKGNVPDYVRRGGATYRVISDHLGIPRHLVNVSNSGDVPFTASYTSFGEVSGTGLDWMPFGFAGGIHDSDSGLVRFGARDYDPTVGRWVSKDPIRFQGRQANFYVYVGNDPVNLNDPSGLQYAGTTDCSYYTARCYQNGGAYYCDTAPPWCERWGDSPWSNCTRSCLQSCDAYNNPNADNFSPGYDEEAGECAALAPEKPNNDFWDESNFDCHAICYASCWGLLATGGL
jgi:RHS repeat-associated protein